MLRWNRLRFRPFVKRSESVSTFAFRNVRDFGSRMHLIFAWPYLMLFLRLA